MRDFLRNNFLSLAGLFKAPKPGVHIINAHYISNGIFKPEHAADFEKFLQHLVKKSRLITLQEATQQIVSKQLPHDESLVAFTFDDGFEECYEVIAPILEKYKCNAGFFINANYVESDDSYRKKYHERVNTFTKKPMNWQQIEALHQRGHVIGSHTLDHFNMVQLSENDLRYQLAENKKILEERLCYDCDYFAWPFGQLRDFPPKAWEITKDFHPFIFSGTNYKHYLSYHDRIINRRHIEPFWPKNHIDYFLSVKKK
ncbi:MAG TPA: deacetylase [Chryseobacterium sp.]|nr:deacetylase [Chryseobacterium sp.]